MALSIPPICSSSTLVRLEFLFFAYTRTENITVSLQYEPRPTRGIPPSARGYHAATLADGRLWIFGGYDGRTAHDDVHMLDLASSAYLSQVTGFSIDVDSDMSRR